MGGLIVVLLGLLVVAMGIGITRRQSRARTNKLEVIAQQLGYRFDRAAGKVDIIPDHKSFGLLRSSGGRILNRMFAHTNNDSMMFDYRFTQHSGRHSHWVYQTVVYFSNVTPLPSFVMRPENVFHKIGSPFGYRASTLPVMPVFPAATSLEVKMRKLSETSLRPAC